MIIELIMTRQFHTEKAGHFCPQLLAEGRCRYSWAGLSVLL